MNFMDSRILTCLLFVCVLLCAAGSEARAGETLLDGAAATPITEDYFCMHVHSKTGYEAAFSAAPFRYLRTWDSSIGWPLIEPENDVWDWELLDRYVELARANGEQIVLTLGMTPLWAAKDPDAPSPYGTCSGSPPRELADWEDFIRHVAERNEAVYGGAIRHWEIWNEPDNFVGGYEFYSGTVPELLDMARSAHRIIKQANPDNRILSPGITQVGMEWLDEYLSGGGAAITDIVAFHFYWDWFTPALRDYKNAILPLHELMKKHGLQNKPLWITETGIGLKYNGSDAARAMAMVPLLAAPRLYGAAVSCNYAWNNSLFTGMFDVKEQKTTITYDTYMALHRWLLGSRIIALRQGPRNTGYVEIERNGRTARILFRVGGGAIRYPADPAWGDTAHHIDGTQSPVPADRKIELNGAPLLIGDVDF
jgi:hypothetical protein